METLFSLGRLFLFSLETFSLSLWRLFLFTATLRGLYGDSSLWRLFLSMETFSFSMETFPLYEDFTGTLLYGNFSLSGDFTGTLRGLFSMDFFFLSLETFSLSLETFSLYFGDRNWLYYNWFVSPTICFLLIKNTKKKKIQGTQATKKIK